LPKCNHVVFKKNKQTFKASNETKNEISRFSSSKKISHLLQKSSNSRATTLSPLNANFSLLTSTVHINQMKPPSTANCTITNNAEAGLLFKTYSPTSVLPVTTPQNTLQGFIIPLTQTPTSIPTLPTAIGLTAPLVSASVPIPVSSSTLFTNVNQTPVVLNPPPSTLLPQSPVTISASRPANNKKEPVRLNNISITPIESNNSLLSQFSTVSTPSGTAIMHSRTINSYFMNKSNLEPARPKRSPRNSTSISSSKNNTKTIIKTINNNNNKTLDAVKKRSNDSATSEASIESNSSPTVSEEKEAKQANEESINSASSVLVNTSNELTKNTPEKSPTKSELLKRKNDSIVDSIVTTLEILNDAEKKAEVTLAQNSTTPKRGLPIVYRVGSRKRLIQSIENSFVNMETSKYGNEQELYKLASNTTNNHENKNDQKLKEDQECLNHASSLEESTKSNKHRTTNKNNSKSDLGSIVCSICFKEFSSKCE
jgi:hypothetical protein